MWRFFASAATFNEVRHIRSCPAIEKLKTSRKKFKLEVSLHTGYLETLEIAWFLRGRKKK